MIRATSLLLPEALFHAYTFATSMIRTASLYYTRGTLSLLVRVVYYVTSKTSHILGQKVFLVSCSENLTIVAW